MKQKWNRPLALLLSAAMLFSMSGTPVYAADMETGASAVCPHHVHDETCGYSEGTPCTHEHTDYCYTLVSQCVHEHTAECYSDGLLPAEGEEKEADACTHVCSGESGCITKELNCQHVHDETCGYSEGSPCTFDPADCELCNPTDSGEPEAPAECTCETLCTEDSVDPDCPVCGAEGADLADCTGAAPALLAKIAQLSKLVVGGTTVVENSQTTENTSGQGWSYDVDSNTLTLKNATINGTDTIYHVGAGIFASGDLTIVLEGSSTVKGVQDPNGETQSIRVEGNLTIQGGGSLTAQGAETSSGSSYGIFVFGSFTQQSGSVTASGGNINGNHTSTGLYVSDGTVTAQDGTLTATGGDTSGRSYGISANGSVTVSDATVTATGGTGNYSYGLYVNSSSSSPSPSVTLSGSGSLAARSGSGTDTAVGIYFQNPFGSTRSVTVGDNSTLLTNSVILYDNSFEAKPLTPTGDGSWLIYGQSDQPSAVGGNYTLEENITIPSGAVVTIPAGSTLTVPQGKTLTVDGTLNIANQSSLAGEGTLEAGENSTFNLTNPEPVISGDTELTYDGTDQSGKFTLTAPTDTVEVMGQSFTISDDATTEGWSLETQEIKDAGNYTLTASNGTTNIEKKVTVSPAEISITSATVQGKTYDGNTTATVESVEFTGLQNDESLTSGTDYTATAAFNSANAGSQTATVTVTLADTVKNYTLASDGKTTTATAAIHPLPVVLEWGTISFTYDGSEKTVTATVTNRVGEDVITLSYEGNTGTAVNSYTATVTGLGNDNYTLTEATGVTQAWSIGEASIADATVELSETEFTYTGQSQKPTVTVKLGNATLTESDYTVTYNGDCIDAGTYTVTVTGKGNYSGTATSKPTYTIHKAAQAALTITSTSDATYGQDYTLTTSGGSGSGAVTITVSNGTGAATVSGYTLTPTKAGTVTVTAVKAGDNNYNDGTSVSATITINKGTYNGTKTTTGSVLANWPGEVTLPAIPDGASYGTPSGSDVTGLSITDGKLSYTGGDSIQKGQTYEITVPVTGATNYENYNITITLTGTDKKVLTITGVTAQNGTYNGQAQAGYTGTPSAEDYTGDFTVTYSPGDTTSPTNAGTYTVTIAIPDSDPQYVGSIVLEFAIAKKPLTVSAPSASVYVGDNAPELALTYTGLVDGESVTPSEAPAFTITKSDDTEIALADAVKTAGTYTITWSNADGTTFTGADNYDITLKNTGTLTVTTRPSSGGGTTTPSGPSTGGSDGWTEIEDEVDETPSGSTVTVDMNGTTEVPAEVFEAVAGKDVTLELDMGGGVKWEINGQDIPTDLDITDLDLGVSLNTSDIPMDVINMVTGEKSTVQLSLAHDGEFGFTMTLTAPVGTQNKGLWANLYHYDTTRKQMLFETAAQVDASGNVALKFSHASEYAIVLDESSHELPFTDTAKGAWYQGAVEYVYRNGIMTGTSATTFEPNAPLSRAMVAQILYNLEGQPTVEGESTFADASGHWAVNAIAWAQQTGVVNGYEDNTFRPNRAASREELAQMLYNYAKVKCYDLTASGDLTAFPDGSKVSSWAEAAMAWANGNELINGHDDGTLQPGGDSTRAQAASILMNFDVNLAN